MSDATPALPITTLRVREAIQRAIVSGAKEFLLQVVGDGGPREEAGHDGERS